MAKEEASEEEFEMIMVTASKRQTGLQATPIAVSVTSAEDIEQSKVLDIQDLQTIDEELEEAEQKEADETASWVIKNIDEETSGDVEMEVQEPEAEPIPEPEFEKDEVKEVKQGLECGMAFENYQDIRDGDKIECFDVKEIERSL